MVMEFLRVSLLPPVTVAAFEVAPVGYINGRGSRLFREKPSMHGDKFSNRMFHGQILRISSLAKIAKGAKRKVFGTGFTDYTD